MKINTIEQLDAYAGELASKLKGSELVTLSGKLGVGKTTFTKLLLKHLGVIEIVNSPTFTIMKNYKSNVGNIYHIDAYRLNDAEIIHDELNSESLRIIEWPSMISDYLPNIDYEIEMTIDDKGRNLICK